MNKKIMQFATNVKEKVQQAYLRRDAKLLIASGLILVVFSVLTFLSRKEQNISASAAGTAASETENGTLLGNVQVIDDVNASGGKAVLFTVATGSATPTPLSDSGPFIAYSPTSFFRTPLGPNAPVASDSAAGIAWLKAHDKHQFPYINGVDGNIWGIAFAIGTCTDPIWKFDSTASVPAGQDFLKTEGFHAPTNWTQNFPNNNDAPIEIIDRCGVPSRPNGFSVWGANVYYNGNTNRILTTNPLSNSGSIVGGSFAHDSNGVDSRDAHSSVAGQNINMTSRGNIPDSFAIRDDLLQYAMNGGNNGSLGHVLQLFFVESNSYAGKASPLIGFEKNNSGCGGSAYQDLCGEGQRIAIKPTWTPPSTCTGAALAVAKTLQQYGAYIGNNSGSGTGIKAQQNSQLLHQSSLGNCFTWDDMYFVQPGWSASW